MHSTSSLISVVMSVYNGEDTLSITLDSILSQEGVDLEFIVVNDGSTDDTLQILDKYAGRDKRLKVHLLHARMQEILHLAVDCINNKVF